MADKPNYRVNRRDVKMTERVAMAAVGKSVLRAQKVHGTDTSIMFAERASGYHTSPHMHDCEQMNYIVSGEIYFFVDGRGYRCKAGDVMRIPRNKMHWAWNRGKETAIDLRIAFAATARPWRRRLSAARAGRRREQDPAHAEHPGQSGSGGNRRHRGARHRRRGRPASGGIAPPGARRDANLAHQDPRRRATVRRRAVDAGIAARAEDFYAGQDA